MVRAVFWYRGGQPVGFDLSGHAGGVAGRDIVCAAVSSAAYMAANTLTDVCGCAADIIEEDGHLRVRLSDADAKRGETVLCGFALHMKALRDQYPNQIEVNDTEV